MEINFFPKLNFTKFLNRNVKIVFTKFEGNGLARRRSVLLIFPIFHNAFVCIFFPANRVYSAKFENKCMEIRKINQPSLPVKMASKTEIGSLNFQRQMHYLAVKFPLHCGASRSVLTNTSIICTSFAASFITQLFLSLIFNYFLFNYSVND